jgi:uncharacterized damage-inducible protein DinB
MLETCRDLVAHKGHANAALMSAIGRHPDARADPEIRGLLDHILIANRFWLLALLGHSFEIGNESSEGLSFDGLVEAYRQTQEREAEWLLAATERDLGRVLELTLIPGGRCRVSEAILQVCMHTHGHRAQCARLLRKHGGVPPVTDFIAWVATRPEADWP